MLEIARDACYSTIWHDGQRRDPGGRLARRESRKTEAWRRNVAEAGLAGRWPELERDAGRLLAIEDGLDIVFIVAWKDATSVPRRGMSEVEPGVRWSSRTTASSNDILQVYRPPEADPASSGDRRRGLPGHDDPSSSVDIRGTRALERQWARHPSRKGRTVLDVRSRTPCSPASRRRIGGKPRRTPAGGRRLTSARPDRTAAVRARCPGARCSRSAPRRATQRSGWTAAALSDDGSPPS